MTAHGRGGRRLVPAAVLVVAMASSPLLGCSSSAPIARTPAPVELSNDPTTWTCDTVADVPVRGRTDAQTYFHESCITYADELAKHEMTPDGFTMQYCQLDVTKPDTPAYIVVQKAACDAFVASMRTNRV